MSGSPNIAARGMIPPGIASGVPGGAAGGAPAAMGSAAGSAGSTGGKSEHPISLKVMRLRKPEFAMQFPVVCEPTEILGNANNKSFEKPGQTRDPEIEPPFLEALAYTDKMSLPISFGQIYVGETFSCYISLHNNSYKDVKNVAIKAELMTGTQRINLLDISTSPIPVFAPGKNNDFVVEQPLSESGTHILVCTVTYDSIPEQSSGSPVVGGGGGMNPTMLGGGGGGGSGQQALGGPYSSYGAAVGAAAAATTSTGAVGAGVGAGASGGGGGVGGAAVVEQRSFRKIFKFPVNNPLAMKSVKVYTLKEHVFVHLDLQNLTNGPLYVETVKLQPTMDFNLINHSTHNLGEAYEQPMAADETRKFLYELVPKTKKNQQKPGAKMNLSNLALGKIEIQWKSNLGETGKLVTNTIQHKSMVPRPDIELVVEDINPNPKSATGEGGDLTTTITTNRPIIAEQEFTVKCRVYNHSDRNVVLVMKLDVEKMYPLVVSGSSVKNIGSLAPNSHKQIELCLFALQAGVQSLGEKGGIQIKDVKNGIVYPITNLCQLLVENPNVVVS